MHGENLKSKI